MSKSNKVILPRKIAKLALLLFLTGCATTSGPNVRMIGTEADFITKAGFAKELQYNWLTDNIYKKDTPAIFSSKDEKVIWFMMFQNAAFLSGAQFTARWIKPDGAVFKEQEFGLVHGTPNAAITDLRISGTDAVKVIGKWKLEVLYKGALIAKRTFTIVDAVS